MGDGKSVFIYPVESRRAGTAKQLFNRVNSIRVLYRKIYFISFGLDFLHKPYG